MESTDPHLQESQFIWLIEARHPLLGDDAVPITMRMEPHRRGLVITGPNTGGKTVALKTIGLLSMMHQAGMQIPARAGSRLPVFDGIYADIGDAQSIDRSVSTFSSHMGRVVDIIGRATDESLVLLDELGTGTDPEEGSALARSILDHLVERSIWSCITTHHRQVSEFAAAHESLDNASVELDPETLLPSYRLIMGVPGQSYAMHVAERLGMPRDVLDTATGMLDPHRSEAENILKRLQADREELRAAQERASSESVAAQELRRAAELELDEAAQEREQLVEETREQLRNEAQRVRRQLRRLMREAKGRQSWELSRDRVSGIVREVRDANWMRDESRSKPLPREGTKTDERERDQSTVSVGVGDEVKVESLGLVGEVVEIGSDGDATVLAGAMRFHARPHMMKLVRRAGEGRPAEFESSSETDVEVAPIYEVSGDLDVRGSRVHMIESVVPQFVDRAFMQGLTTIRIIHGVGSGALREAVRDVLAREPHVEAFQQAPMDQGGDSVTVALLE